MFMRCGYGRNHLRDDPGWNCQNPARVHQAPTRNPQAPPIQSLYGDFYGTATGVVDGTRGTLYKIDTNGDYTELHLFLGSDGLNPIGPLVQATNYWFYGTASGGGTNGAGTIFRISSSGEFEVLHNFDGTDGANPLAGLIQANDGNFYGVTSRGGSSGGGVIFRMTPAHQFTVLHNFTGGSYTSGPTAGNDGAGPLWQLVQATDGYLYGTTFGGGNFGWGVLFRISTSGEFTVLHNFSATPSCMNALACFDGANPVALIQHTNGFLYGFTEQSGEGWKRRVLPLRYRPASVCYLSGQLWQSGHDGATFSGSTSRRTAKCSSMACRRRLPRSSPIT